MTGAEYLTADVLRGAVGGDRRGLRRRAGRGRGPSVQDFLKRLNPAWNLVGRVHFNLAENRKDEEAPFAFLATYTTRLSAHGKAQHLPLGQALREYAGRGQQGAAALAAAARPARRRALRLAAGAWSTRARSSTRCAGRRAEAFRFLSDVPSWSAPGSSCACPPPGGPAARRARR